MSLFKSDVSEIDKKIIDNLRGLAIDLIDNANSGHPGIALGACPIVYTLYANHLRVNPKDEKWINRDRFVLSAGHASALLYSVLYMAGFELSLDDLKSFRKIHSLTPGHPEYMQTPGVDVGTGPLGQGVSNAVGIAIGEKYLESYFGKNIIDYYTYVLCGDGDLMEGISYEACCLAGKLKLNKLILLYDSNDVTLDGKKEASSLENTKLRFESINWNYILVEDGEDINQINDAINKAKNCDKPSIIEIKTIIGKYSKNQGTSKVHGGPLDKEDIISIKETLNLRDIPFTISDEALTSFRNKISERCEHYYLTWLDNKEKLDSDKLKELDNLFSKEPIIFKGLSYEIPSEGSEATRVSSGKIINSIAMTYPFLIGGSADVASSTKAKIEDFGDFSNDNPSGRNINYGVREHAMGGITNGIALTGLTPFASCFLAFSDYMKSSIRMSALMDLPVIYVFSHDSITVGEDGPAHQPVEQLIGLRSIPNLDVYRPCDLNEVTGSYKAIFENRKPAVMVLGRNKVNIHEQTSIKDVANGAYILEKEIGKLDCIIISTGEEVDLALEVNSGLIEKGIGSRVISMPSIELYQRTDDKYKQSLFPVDIPVFVIEASSSYSWYQFVKNKDYLFTVDTFGLCGSKNDILEEFKLTKKDIVKRIEELLK